MSKKESYASAGVQIRKAESFVERIKSQARRPEHAMLWKAAGAYAAVSPVTEDLAVAITTDGVGTKLLVANELKKHESIGIDLVAMCANDLICVGASPSLFLDYYAVGHLEDSISDELIKGIIRGCDLASMILAGGETAELPGLYEKGHYDLAGFALGTVEKSRLLNPEKIKPEQALIGIASSGIHSNGLSLARKVVDKKHWDLLLEPTAIYVKAALACFDQFPGQIQGLVHITGGGWRNLLRLNHEIGFEITTPLATPEIFSLIEKHVEEEEMYKTFNMGMGLAVICEQSQAAAIAETFAACGHDAKLIGKVIDDPGIVRIAGKSFVLKEKLKEKE